MEADFDSDESGDPHGEFLALVNKQLLIEREAEKILKLMNGGSDDSVTESDKNSQNDGASNRHTDTISNRVVIKVEKEAAGEENLLGKADSDLPITGRKIFQTAQAAVPSSQLTKNTSVKVKTEPGNLPKSFNSHSQSPIACSQRVALQSPSCTEAAISGQNLQPQAPGPISVSSSNAVSGSVTQMPTIIQGETVHTLTPGYQVLPQMTWQGFPIVGQPYAGVTNAFPVLNNQPQSGEQLSSALNAISSGSMTLASKAASSLSSVTTSSCTQPVQTTPFYRVIPIVQHPFIISPATATTQSLQQTESKSTQSKNTLPSNSKPGPTDLQLNGSLQPIGLLPQASGMDIGSLQSNGLVYQIPQQNLITQQSNGLVLQPNNIPSRNLASNNTTLSPQVPSLQSDATVRQASQPNQTSLQLNSSGLQIPQTSKPSLQSNSPIPPQAPEGASPQLASMWQVLSLLQQNNQYSPLILNTQTQQSTSQGLTNVVHCSLAGTTPNILSSVIPTPSALNTQTQQNTVYGLSNKVRSPLVGATPNILPGVIATPTALNTQTQQNTAKGLSTIVNSPLVGIAPNMLTGLIPTPTALNTQTQQNTVQGLPNMVNSPLVGATPNILSSAIPTPSALNTHTKQNTLQGLSDVVDKSQACTPPNTLTILQQSLSPVKTEIQQDTVQGLSNVVNGSAPGAVPDILTNVLQTPLAQTQAATGLQGVPKIIYPSLNGVSPTVFTNRYQILSALNNQIAQAVAIQAGSLLGGTTGQIPKPVSDLANGSSQGVRMAQRKGQKRTASEIDLGLHKRRKILPKDDTDD